MNRRRVKGIVRKEKKKVKNPHIISGGNEKKLRRVPTINHLNGRVLKEAKQ